MNVAFCVLCAGMVDMEVSPVRATASRVTEDTARVQAAAPGRTVRDTAPATAQVHLTTRCLIIYNLISL